MIGRGQDIGLPWLGAFEDILIRVKDFLVAGAERYYKKVVKGAFKKTVSLSILIIYHGIYST